MPRGGATGAGGFNSSSKLLQKRWDERQYRLHQQKVRKLNKLFKSGFTSLWIDPRLTARALSF